MKKKQKQITRSESPEYSTGRSSVFAEVNTVIDETFLLLDRYELEEISLTLPKGLLYFATYLSIREHETTPSGSLTWERFIKNNADKTTIPNRNKWLSRILKNALDEHLTHLIEGTHTLLYPCEYRNSEEPEDDEIWDSYQ